VPCDTLDPWRRVAIRFFLIRLRCGPDRRAVHGDGIEPGERVFWDADDRGGGSGTRQGQRIFRGGLVQIHHHIALDGGDDHLERGEKCLPGHDLIGAPSRSHR